MAKTPHKKGRPTASRSKTTGPRGRQANAFEGPRPKPFRGAKKPAQPARAELPEAEEMRLNKYIAHCGICSRRQAIEYVKDGLVSVNGAVVTEPGYLVRQGEVVRFKEQVIKPEQRKVYILMNKPKGYITTLSDERGRDTVMDLLKGKVKERVFPVGRLDRATTGLLVLTNDGELAKKLSHPSHKMKKVYHVVLDRPLPLADLERILQGLELEDGPVKVDAVGYVQGAGKNEIGIEIHVGRNRIVRRIFEHLGYEVKRLDRTFYAGLTKKDLPRGFWRHLSEKEVIMLKHFTGR
jgi:23S rRNA pseudouridine2605 synthase